MFEEEMIFELMKSVDLQPLQYLAAVRVGISVCETEDMQYMIRKFRKMDVKVRISDGQWRLLRGRAKRKLNEIGVPDFIINIVLENLWPISFEILKWILYHVEDTGIDCSPNFCWTPQNSIDYEKTAEILVKDEVLDINKRFKLACFYCLDSEVRSLWEKMGRKEKRSFFVRGKLETSNLNPIVRYWAYFIQEVPIDSWGSKALNNKKLFTYAMHNGYLSATKYFFRKLKARQRKQTIANGFNITDILIKLYYEPNIAKHKLANACFLIWQLPSSHHLSTSILIPSIIFYYFLEWPFQKHFMTVVNRLRHHLDGGMYADLLERIFNKVIEGFKDHDYKELFMEFWQQCPENFKTHEETKRLGYQILMEFMKRYFKFVFEENSFALKAKFRGLVFQKDISENITYFEKENVEFFKFLVRESVTTKSCILNPSIGIFRFHGTNDFLKFSLGELIYLIDGILRNM